MKRLIVVLSVIFLAVPSPAGQKVDVKTLPEKYRDWLKLVTYIIVPVEKDVFLKLTNDRDRDIFLETFWKQRDPTPGTPENEYRDEVVKRFAYVQKTFRRGTSREGWQTDLGKFYMILGAPVSIERFESGFIYPAQAWTYYGDVSKQLPNMFVLLFYQRGGVGEYKLYDHVADGPANLLINKRNVNPTDYEDLYEKILEISPTLAELAISIIPGEHGYDYSPSPRNNIILADIIESPKKDINPSYATHFLDYKGFVSTEYLTNYIDSDTALALIRDPLTGIRFLHFSIVPKSLSVDFYDPKSQYFCNFRIDVSLRVGDEIVFQYARDFPLYFPEADIGRVRGNGISIEDSFPVIEGTYKLIILLQNSVGKEFSILERDLAVPPDPATAFLTGPFLGYKTDSYQRELHVPFKIVDKKLAVDPKNAFGTSDRAVALFTVNNLTEELRQGGEVRISVRGLREKDPIQKSSLMKLSAYAYMRILSLEQPLPLQEMEPDYYELTATLVSETGAVLDEKRGRFIVSPDSVVGHPIAHAKAFPLANQFLYFYMMAQQYEKTNQGARAREEYENAFRLGPGYKNGVLFFGNFLIDSGDFERALQLAEILKEDEKFKFDYYLLRGKALMGQGKYDDAILNFLEGNKVYNSDVRLLNALGLCHYRKGDKAQALEVLRASLRLNPSQAEVQKLIAEVEKK